MKQSVLSCILLLVFGVEAAMGGVSESGKGKVVRWHDHIYGISFVIPEGMKGLLDPVEGERCRFTNDKFAFSFSVIKTIRDPDRDGGKGKDLLERAKPKRITTGGVGPGRKSNKEGSVIGVVLGDDQTTISDVERAIRLEVLATARNTKALFFDDRVTMAGRTDCLVEYLNVPGKIVKGVEEEAWVLGLGVMKIDPHHFMVMRLEAGASDYQESREMFDGVIKSLEMLKPQELDAQRKGMIERGLFLGDLIDVSLIKKMVPQNRYFVIRDGKEAIGYMQAGYYAEEKDNKRGYALGVKSKIKTKAPVGKNGRVVEASAGQSQSSTALSFIADDGSYDLFESGKVVKQYTELEGQVRLEKFSAGVQCYRDEDLVHIQKDFGLDRRQPLITRVKPGYLSQLQAFDLGYYLPHRKEQSYGYYAFDGIDKVIKLHIALVVPGEAGAYRVNVFAGFDRRATVYQYDKDGELVWWMTPTGYKIEAVDLKAVLVVKRELFPK